MNCRDYQDQLAEWFDSPNLPDDLAAHVADCSECSEFLSEMRMISERLGTANAFYPEPDEAELVAQVVEREIRATAHVTQVIRPNWWVRVAGVAAAAVVIFAAVVVTWKFTQRPGTSVDSGGSSQIADTSLLDSQDEIEELPSDVVRLLLHDVSASGNFKVTEELLDDMSDEEAAYLRTSLKAGDLL